MKTHFSAEFFPPQVADGNARLKIERANLRAFSPAFFSVTYGAGGSTRGRTFSLIKEITFEKAVPAVPHLSCIGASAESLLSLLKAYKDLNIKQIMALRGDLPSGMAEAGEFRHAVDLVRFIHEHFGDTFALSVAAYPETHPGAKTAESDLDAFVQKVKAGAQSAFTQYFFNADSYFHFVEEVQKRGVEIPIIPGVMPIVNFERLARFSDACGAEIPRWLRLKLESFQGDFESSRAFGLDVITELCRRLLEKGAPGLHFYTMNQSALVVEIMNRLKSAGFYAE